MRMSRLFGQTLRRAPADVEVASHQLLVRAGFIRQLAAGVFTALPLARRSLDRIELILREEMAAIGAQEMTMPVIHPAELWQETGRWYEIGAEMGRFKDRTGRDMVLAMTHEEVVADLVRHEIRSYRQLPALLYHIQTKWRDDPRPRAGLIRVREFTMLDSYSLDLDEDGLDQQYRAHFEAYQRIFHRCGLPVAAVEADTGVMGGSASHEFMVLTTVGEDTLVLCDTCGYTTNRQVAKFGRPDPKSENPLPLEKVATPGASTIAGLAEFLGIEESQTAKAFVVVATVRENGADVERLVLAIVRGDMEVNETKLANTVRARELRPAQDDEIRAVGAVRGAGEQRYRQVLWAEVHHDEQGLVWPISVAPFDVHLVALRGATEEAEVIYTQLQGGGIDVLHDDRDERPGVKFNDADLIGVPIRLTLGKRSLAQGGAEMKLRREADSALVPLDSAVEMVKAAIADLWSELT